MDLVKYLFKEYKLKSLYNEFLVLFINENFKPQMSVLNDKVVCA